MIKLVQISILAIIITLSSCKPINVEPVGFINANYNTSVNEHQTFEYFYDDGELVAGGLDEYIAKIESNSGTFKNESMLLLKFKRSIEQLSDSLIPFTYFMGINYADTILKDVKFSFNLNYQYNNPSHINRSEYFFLKENISFLKLYKIEYETLASLYYDPDIILSEYPFEIIGDDVVFETKDKNSLFGLCWSEETWTDTVTFQKGSLTQQNIYKGNRAQNDNLEGAYLNLENQQFYMNYSDLSMIDSLNSIYTGWHFHKLNMIIDNPQNGIIEHSSVYLDAVIYKYNPGFPSDKSYLKITDNTIIEFINWPGTNEFGKLHIYGTMFQESNQLNTSIDLIINFKRQR